MKILALLLSLFALNAHSQASVILGLFTTHHGDGTYEDYRRPAWYLTENKRPYNEGAFVANRLVGLQYSTNSWSAGVCTFENSFYERTQCVYGAIHYSMNNNWQLVSGINLTYGYRPALVLQEHEASMSKAIMPTTFGGVKFKHNRIGVTWQLISSAVSTIVLEIGL